MIRLCNNIGETTGFSHAKCYLKNLHDCSKQISDEHYFSKNLLKELQEESILLIEGFKWAERPKPMPIDRLISKVLCKRHNEQLSELDVVGGKFLRTIKLIENDFKNSDESGSIYLFAGEDFERWMLKTLMGIISSGNATQNGNKLPKEIDPIWADILFGRLDFSSRTGLHFDKNKIKSFAYQDYVGFQPLCNLDDDNRIIGGNFFLMGFTLTLLMIPSIDNQDILYRPQKLLFKNNSVHRTIEFAWTDTSLNKTIWFDRNPNIL